ncbi:baseplate assembly protein V [Aeromonas phage 85AhydR10PP]|nr:baseplate assembly protein V [Aeromonas phage 85AhydR10PP]
MSILDRLEALERRLEQMWVRGTIAEVNCTTQRVRVRYGEDSVTEWIEWKPQRSGQVTIWSPPSVGEGCTILSDGDVNQGEVFLGSYYDQCPAPSTNPDDVVMKMPDGTVFTYNHKDHKLHIDVKGETLLEVSGNLTAKAKGDLIAEAGGDARVKAAGQAIVEAGGQVMLKGAGISMNGGGGGTMEAGSGGVKLGGGGSGVVTGAHVCAYTGKPHAACSGTVFAAG